MPESWTSLSGAKWQQQQQNDTHNDNRTLESFGYIVVVFSWHRQHTHTHNSKWWTRVSTIFAFQSNQFLKHVISIVAYTTRIYIRKKWGVFLHDNMDFFFLCIWCAVCAWRCCGSALPFTWYGSYVAGGEWMNEWMLAATAAVLLLFCFSVWVGQRWRSATENVFQRTLYPFHQLAILSTYIFVVLSLIVCCVFFFVFVSLSHCLSLSLTLLPLFLFGFAIDSDLTRITVPIGNCSKFEQSAGKEERAIQAHFFFTSLRSTFVKSHLHICWHKKSQLNGQIYRECCSFCHFSSLSDGNT